MRTAFISEDGDGWGISAGAASWNIKRWRENGEFDGPSWWNGENWVVRELEDAETAEQLLQGIGFTVTWE